MLPPKTAYILLWFPKPSETFIFNEVLGLRKLGLPLSVFTLYGKITRNLSDEMKSTAADVERLGVFYLLKAPGALCYWFRRNPKGTLKIITTILFRRWRGLEKSAESLWAFLGAFSLARRFEEENIQHIHAPWASGPATAAWVCSWLTGIPFSFTARAWDIYPPDSLLKEKIQAARFIRSETAYNIKYLSRFTAGAIDKFQLTHNGVPTKPKHLAEVKLREPLQLLALGRFVEKKGFEYLIRACKILSETGVDFQLTLAGDGSLEKNLRKLSHQLELEAKISFPGFLAYDAISELFQKTDIFIMPCVIDKSGDRDGIPTVIMEALIHRVPVITTGVSGIPELIKDNQTGLLVPVKDPRAIAEAVTKLKDDRKKALELAEQGRQQVLEHFNPDKNHLLIFELYQKALDCQQTS